MGRPWFRHMPPLKSISIKWRQSKLPENPSCASFSPPVKQLCVFSFRKGTSSRPDLLLRATPERWPEFWESGRYQTSWRKYSLQRCLELLYLKMAQHIIIWKKGSCWLQEVWGWTSWKIVRRIDLTVLFFQIDLSEDTWVKLWRCFCDVLHCLSFWIESASQEMSKKKIGGYEAGENYAGENYPGYIHIYGDNSNSAISGWSNQEFECNRSVCQVQILLRIEWCKSEGAACVET